MNYQQITTEERYNLSIQRKQGLSIATIATELGRHRSTIYREVNRNSSVRDGHYRASEADGIARTRRSVSRRNQQYTEDEFRVVKKLLRQHLSPEQITGFIRRLNLLPRSPSHELIYQYIWEDKSNGGNLWVYLRQSGKQRRKRYKAYDSRGRLANKRHISERPESVEGRQYKGHWEIDTVHGRGSRHCIVTLLERKTGYVMIGKLTDKSTVTLNKKTLKLISRDPGMFKTITADNGTEFHQYKKIENKYDVKFYFANPFHSWERGSVENINGLIRQYLPKNQSMEKLTQQQCDVLADKLNQRPRKRFGYKTPEEMYYA